MLKILATAALVIASVLVTAPPPAHAEVCADAGGRRHVSVGGCVDPGRDIVGGAAIAGVAIAAGTDPYWPGQIPCYSAEGVPYYTPDGDPC